MRDGYFSRIRVEGSKAEFNDNLAKHQIEIAANEPVRATPCKHQIGHIQS